MSIHNIEYQGRYAKDTLGDLFGLDYGWAADGTIMMDGDVNLLKGAILCADAVNAVSPTYANELKMAYFAHHMESIMNRGVFPRDSRDTRRRMPPPSPPPCRKASAPPTKR